MDLTGDVEMDYNTILLERSSIGLHIILNRPEEGNTLTTELIRELDHVFNLVKNDSEIKVVILEGKNGVFCKGMDFKTAVSSTSDDFEYMDFLKNLSLMSKIIISSVDGQVMAGGVGLAAASDIVIATPQSNFSLPEALWGLLPAVITPFIVRRVGFQKAYAMTLTTMPISAEDAYSINLVDHITETPEKTIRQLGARVLRLEISTIEKIKNYFRKMWIINEEMEQTAVSEIKHLMSDERVKENIRNFVEHQKFPWDK